MSVLSGQFGSLSLVPTDPPGAAPEAPVANIFNWRINENYNRVLTANAGSFVNTSVSYFRGTAFENHRGIITWNGSFEITRPLPNPNIMPGLFAGFTGYSGTGINNSIGVVGNIYIDRLNIVYDIQNNRPTRNRYFFTGIGEAVKSNAEAFPIPRASVCTKTAGAATLAFGLNQEATDWTDVVKDVTRIELDISALSFRTSNANTFNFSGSRTTSFRGIPFARLRYTQYSEDIFLWEEYFQEDDSFSFLIVPDKTI